MLHRHEGSNKKLNGDFRITRTFELSDSTSTTFVTECSFEKGLKHGTEFWYVDGSPRSKSTYEKGVLHGEKFEYDEGEEIVSLYSNGIKDGPQQTFREGILVSKVEFADGIKTGKEVFLDSAGNEVSSASYEMLSEIPDELLRNKDAGIHLPFGAKESLTIGEFLERYEVLGTLHVSGYKNDDGCCLPGIRSAIDDSRFDRLWVCEFPPKYGYAYIIDYGYSKLDQILTSIHLVYTSRMGHTGLNYLRVYENGDMISD